MWTHPHYRQHESFRYAYITNPVIPLILSLRLSALTKVLHNSCNKDTRNLPEMYAYSPRAAPLDFWEYFWKITRAHVTTIKYTQYVYLVNILSQCNM